MILDKTEEARAAFTTEVNRRKQIDHQFSAFAQSVHNADSFELMAPKDFDCLRMMVDTYTEFCGPFNDYEMKYGSYFVGACELYGNSNHDI